MAPKFQIIALSSLDPFGDDKRDEPYLLYPDALKAAQALKAQGKAFRVVTEGSAGNDQKEALRALGGIE